VMEWCCLCKTSGESIDHLFLHCVVALELWSVFFQLFGVAWVMPHSVSEMLGCWRGQAGNRETAFMVVGSFGFDVMSLA
jgi:hypothetical protein